MAQKKVLRISWRNTSWRPRVRVRPGAAGAVRYRAKLAARVRRLQPPQSFQPARRYIFSRLPFFQMSQLSNLASL